jgi:hypothetical protein
MELLVFEQYINSTTRSSIFICEVSMFERLNIRLTIGQFIGKSKLRCITVVNKCGFSSRFELDLTLSQQIVFWLILPVVTCLSQRLSHACLSTHSSKVKPRMAH